MKRSTGGRVLRDTTSINVGSLSVSCIVYSLQSIDKYD